MPTLPPGMFPPPIPPNAGQHVFGQHLPPGRPAFAAEGSRYGVFSDAFDFSFSAYATPALVKVVYMIVFVLSILEFVGLILWSWMVGFLTPIFVIPAVLFGWVPLFAQVLGTRLTLEHYLATAQMAQDIRIMRERGDAMRPHFARP